MNEIKASYNHGQECKRVGIPYHAWCCEACAVATGAKTAHRIGYAEGGWCQVGKHRAEGRTVWTEIDPDAVAPWGAAPDDAAYQQAMVRAAAQPPAIRDLIEAQYNTQPGHKALKQWFAECVAYVLDI